MARALQLLVALCCCTATAVAQRLPSLIPYTDGTRWGYADTLGKPVIALQWPEARFFHDHKAIVVVRKDPRGQYTNSYALIDDKGAYVIAPGAGWNGIWAGSWGATDLNVTDSSGKRGLMDTAGRLLIPYEWDAGKSMLPPSRDSFKIVYLNGYAGIINWQAQIVVPPKWGDITPAEDLAPIRAFVVRDPDNMSGYNSIGVADLQNRSIIPPRYSGINLHKLDNGRLVFSASTQASNEAYSYNTTVSMKYLEYPGGRQIPQPEELKRGQRSEYPLPGGYIVSDRALLDSNRKVVVPCCRFWKMSGDTLFLHDEKRIGKDSVAVTISYLSARTRQPLAAPRRLIIYREDPKPVTLEFGHGYHNYSDREIFRIPLAGYDYVERFYKDSLLYNVLSYAGDHKEYYIIRGETRNTSRAGLTYYAVVDSNLNYVIAPERDYHIHAYYPDFGFALAEGYSRQANSTGHLLLDRWGKEMIPPQRHKILSAFSWQGKIYMFLQVQDECNPEPSGTHIFLTDIKGTPLEAFSKYDVGTRIKAPPQFNRYEYGRSVAGSMYDYFANAVPEHIWVLDSMQRIGVLFPDGRPVYPELNFRYRQLTPTYNNWLLAGNDAGSLMLVDTANRQIPHNLEVYSLAPATTSNTPYNVSGTQPVTVPRLYIATAKDASGKPVIFYLDNTGRAYYSAP